MKRRYFTKKRSKLTQTFARSSPAATLAPAAEKLTQLYVYARTKQMYNLATQESSAASDARGFRSHGVRVTGLKSGEGAHKNSELLARQLRAERALNLGDDLAVGNRLPVLVRVDDLRLLVDGLRELRLRHAL